MFGLIGKSDKAGSGVDKIFKGWRSAKWRQPFIEEHSRPDKVELYLPMESLISDPILNALRENFGQQIDSLAPNEIIILSNAYKEGSVTNISLRNWLDLHPSDITKHLRELVRNKFLITSGFGRGTAYSLNVNYHKSSDVPSSNVPSSNVPSSDVPSSGVPSCGVPSSDSGKVVSEKELVLLFCAQWRNASEIAEHIGRNKQHTQKRIIKRLLDANLLVMEHPDTPTSPKQRYKSKV